jgi:hypothetical protein
MVMKADLQTELPEITMAAGEFKAKCLRLMDEANLTQRRIKVTKRGKSVGHFVPEPPEKKPARSFIGSSSGIKILGDIISPLPQEWTLPEWMWDKPEKSAKKAKKKR